MNDLGAPYGYPDRPPRRARGHRRFGWLFALVLVAALVTTAFSAGRVIGAARSEGWLGALSHPSVSSPLWRGGAGPARAAADAPDLIGVANQVTPSLVDVNTRLALQGAEGAGTGIVLSSNGEVLTNNHVINGATAVQVRSQGTGRVYPATVVGYDRTHDVAVLQLRGASGLRPARLGNSDSVAVGDPVAAVGNAGGVGRPTVAPGRVAALNRSIATSDELSGSTEQLTGLIQVSANVEAGESGGPLVTADGQVVGMTTAATVNFRYQTPGGSGFAIPINSALAIANQIRAGNASATVHIGPTGMLGVTVVAARQTTPYRDSDTGGGGATDSGATVAGVTSGSSAAQVGLERGDMIVSLDGQRVDSPNTLVALVGQHHPGDRVPIGWVDSSGQRHDESVALMPGPPA
ncbi:MAG: trypsin-like peptidase domain-containing protein [Pseudonocardia sp.]|nr:trypsin-like peptidase domain-containing protein [Pseudonocardia sp.]MBO0872271.1 trypsin-like peptidase domain-containing protein [Pseudonocardia sp.]